MRKLKLYIDTSVVSHLFAEDTPEKMSDTIKLWEDFKSGKYELFVSSVVMGEVEKCKEPKRKQMIVKMREIEYKLLSETQEIYDLADEYIKNGVLTDKSYDDCLHIAYAVIYNCDVIISWNFKHLVNFKTIDKVRIVNAINRYKEISIISPTMIIEE